jgi:hypothetical protein
VGNNVFKSVSQIASLVDRYIDLGDISGDSPAKSSRSQKNDTGRLAFIHM